MFLGKNKVFVVEFVKKKYTRNTPSQNSDSIPLNKSSPSADNDWKNRVLFIKNTKINLKK